MIFSDGPVSKTYECSAIMDMVYYQQWVKGDALTIF